MGEAGLCQRVVWQAVAFEPGRDTAIRDLVVQTHVDVASFACCHPVRISWHSALTPALVV